MGVRVHFVRNLRGAGIPRTFPEIGAGRNFKGHLGGGKGERHFISPIREMRPREKGNISLDITKWL